MSNIDRVLVVVPALNEERSIADVVTSVRSHGWDCLVVDDGSSDSTRSRASASGAAVVSLATNLGVGAALRAGFRYAVMEGYTRVVQCDADGQHRAEQIAHLVATARSQDADLVIGSRFLAPDEDSMSVASHRRKVMGFLSWIVRHQTGVQVSDTTSGFKCVSQPLLGEFAIEFPAHFLGDTFEACLVAANNGYLIVEVPATMNERKHGKSSASALQAVRFILRSVAVAFFGLTFQIAVKAQHS